MKRIDEGKTLDQSHKSANEGYTPRQTQVKKFNDGVSPDQAIKKSPPQPKK